MSSLVLASWLMAAVLLGDQPMRGDRLEKGDLVGDSPTEGDGSDTVHHQDSSPRLTQAAIEGRRAGQAAVMPDYSRTVLVQTPPDEAFAWLSDVDNLPRYFDSITEAHREGDEEVHVKAVVPDGTQYESDAYFRTVGPARRIEWGSQDPEADYHGWLTVSEAEGGAAVTLSLHMHHEDADDSIGATLENLQRRLQER